MQLQASTREVAKRLWTRANRFLIDGIVIALILAVWLVKGSAPTSRPISYITGSGHILVQIAESPEPSRLTAHKVPKWTLYGDGTLLFQADPGDSVWHAQLSPGQIQQILDVIVNQNTFFASTKQVYGNLVPDDDGDGDELLLMVDANSQHKEVGLGSEPPNTVAIDAQTDHVFAIKHFLLDYHPDHATLYAPDPSTDLVPDDRAVAMASTADLLETSLRKPSRRVWQI